MVSAQAVKELRARTGAGMMDCKKALVEKNGDLDKAADYLREKGLSAAVKKAGRLAAEGIVDSYIHMNGRIGVLLEINCETDFVAKTPEFKALAHDISMHIAAANPQYVNIEDVDEQVIVHEREVLTAKAKNEPKPKPDNIIEKMVEGGIQKFFKENCLMEQLFVKDTNITIRQLVTEKIAKIGENITIRRFARYEMGEGLEKRQDNFVEEVMSQTK